MPSAVKMGDTMTVDVEVIEKRETRKPQDAIAIFRHAISNQSEVRIM